MSELTKVVLAAVAGSAITAVINYYIFREEKQKPVEGIGSTGRIYAGGCSCGCNKKKQMPYDCNKVITL
jgi:hypothetical protein